MPHPLLTIALTAIQIAADRQRQDKKPEELLELKESIESTQLINPPLLEVVDGVARLVAGEGRLQAVSDIFALGGKFLHNGKWFTAEEGLVPYVDAGQLTEIDRMALELDENLRRRSLTWQEEAAAIAKLKALRESEYAEKVTALTATLQNEGLTAETAQQQAAAQLAPSAPTLSNLATEVFSKAGGGYNDRISKALIVSRHLDNPEVAKAASVKDAIKILKAQEVRAGKVALANSVGLTFSTAQHTILNMDCLAYMRSQLQIGITDTNGYDIILTDPPYGMGADEFGDAAGKLLTIDHSYKDDFKHFAELMYGTDGTDGWCALSYKITKPKAHAYVFCDIDNFHLLRDWMREAGWYVFRTPFTVFKQGSGRVPLPDRGPRRQSEWILYAIKGEKPVNDIRGDVIPCSGDENLGHGAQKPVALMLDLLQRSYHPGCRVLDCFAGTGPVLEAGHKLQCAVTVIEKAKDHYGTILSRVQRLKADEEGKSGSVL